jgi:hypothetical protein
MDELVMLHRKRDLKSGGTTCTASDFSFGMFGPDLTFKTMLYDLIHHQNWFHPTIIPYFLKAYSKIGIPACRYFKGGIMLRGEIDLLKTRVYIGADDREFVLDLGDEQTILRAASSLERTGWLQALALTVPPDAALAAARGQSLDMATGPRTSAELNANSHRQLPLTHSHDSDVLFDPIGYGAGASAARPSEIVLERGGLFPSPRPGDLSLLPGVSLHATPRLPVVPGPDGSGWVNALPYTPDAWQHAALAGERARPPVHHSRAPSADSTLDMLGRGSLHSSRASHRAGPGRVGRGTPTLNLHAEKDEIRMAKVGRAWRA